MRGRVQNGRAGFSLVEVSLALLVVGVGMMGAFALFPAGLDAGKAALEDSRASLFADEAFDSLRALSVAKTNSVMLFSTNSFNDYRDAAPAEPGSEFWSGSTNRMAPRVTDKIWPGTAVSNIAYLGSVTNNRYAPAWQLGLTVPLPEYSFRYRLAAVTSTNRIMRVKLTYWPGEFGPATNTDYVFYTELFNFGM